MEQYGPKIVELSKNKNSRSVAFITSGGCPPIPFIYEDRHKNCLGHTDKLIRYLTDTPSVKEVVITGCFNCYMIQQIAPVTAASTAYRYYYKNGDIIEQFRGGDGKNFALTELVEFIINLVSKGYKVYVVMDNPGGSNFDPKNIIKSENRKRPIILTTSSNFNYSSFSRDPKEIALTEEMKHQLIPAGAIVLDPSPIICPNNVCMAVDSHGKPIYKDTSHIRPFFAKEKIGIFDDIIASE